MQVTALRKLADICTGYSGGGLLAFAVCDRQAFIGLHAGPDRRKLVRLCWEAIMVTRILLT